MVGSGLTCATPLSSKVIPNSAKLSEVTGLGGKNCSFFYFFDFLVDFDGADLAVLAVALFFFFVTGEDLGCLVYLFLAGADSLEGTDFLFFFEDLIGILSSLDS